ncbi:NAD(P)H-hydrate dehydratase [Sphingomonas sp. CROZ-RG-20F-R02-07]|uniref:NAD(P)H-hydrate dehydratase n=1 Tax=Sphingomonas sp. CROZ-RG-20F-R02-07 TaxID=2914832 RepID=UPI001F577120|nr:NAD(P)H-hydrate dehydratase [Sphingomonas sp. CROZ-RG-20F-R02-07]
MIRIDGRPILTAAAMRAAEDGAMTGGVTVDTLMARAGAAIAVAVRRLAGDRAVLVLCGPGNNGGDGYVAAAALKAAGHPVRVAALAAPRSDAAIRARAGWDGPVEPLADAVPAPVLVDALFGTGLTRPLGNCRSPARAGAQMGDVDGSHHDLPDWAPASAGERPVGEILHALAAAATLTIAVDLPSGVDTDSGAVVTEPPLFDVTLALGAAKPSHVLQPAARHSRHVRILDIGVATASDAAVLAAPTLPEPGPDSHKYTRGMVAVVAGTMAGAAELASMAAMRSGAGYVALLGETQGWPHALVRKPLTDRALTDPRVGAIAIGPGLGRDEGARAKLAQALAAGRPIVVDGDALHLTDPATLARHGAPVILTPHAGEFAALFGPAHADKIARARDAARRSDAVVVFKGADTVIAAPDGRVTAARDANDWLSTAGSGDVLVGIVAAMLASGMAPFEAAGAAVWLHGAAARRCGRAFVADDLAAALTPARAALAPEGTRA